MKKISALVFCLAACNPSERQTYYRNARSLLMTTAAAATRGESVDPSIAAVLQHNCREADRDRALIREAATLATDCAASLAAIRSATKAAP